MERIKVPANSVCVSCIGWQMGEVVMADATSVTNQQINTIIPNPRVDPSFLFYSLSLRKKELLSLGSAAGVRTPILNKSSFSNLIVKLPPLQEQRCIASILSAYDDLIENCQRRIKILETMVRSLYEEWFVKFRFPRHETCTFVDSPLGPIPEGWDIVNLEELYNTSSGGTPSRNNPEYYADGIFDWVKSKELPDGFILSSEERITKDALQNSSAKLFPASTVLIALYGATIGKLGILARESATNQACCAILQKKPAFGREFAFLTLLSNREKIISLRLGAAQQNISQVLLRKLECLKPSVDLAKHFSVQSSPVFEAILNLQSNAALLRQSRDLLLSNLIKDGSTRAE